MTLTTLCRKQNGKNRIVSSITFLLLFLTTDVNPFNIKSKQIANNIIKNQDSQSLTAPRPASSSNFEPFLLSNNGYVTNNKQSLQYNEIAQTIDDTSLSLTSILNLKSLPSKSLSNVTPYTIPKESYFVLTMLFFLTALCSLDRVAMSVAIIPMSLELGYSEQVKGSISTMFSFGYLFGIIPAGILGSFISPTLILAMGVFLWSLAQGISPWAAHISYPLLLFCRFAMGLAESAAIPTVQSFVSRFVPEEKKSLILGRFLFIFISLLCFGYLRFYLYLINCHVMLFFCIL